MRIFRGLPLLILLGFFISLNVNSQTKLKIGHIDFAKLYSIMPGLDTAKARYEEYNKSVQEQYATMQTELESKFMDYQANQANLSEIIRQTKESEINDLKTRMDAFETKAVQDLQTKELELTSPIIERAREAVKEVAKENGYTYVLNSTEGLVLYSEPSDDILPVVMKKLGISEDALKNAEVKTQK